LIHNPAALHPLPDGWLGASADERLENGRIVTTFNEPFHPYYSFTEMYSSSVGTSILQERVNGIVEMLLKLYPG
jgi:hypothetical protein